MLLHLQHFYKQLLINDKNTMMNSYTKYIIILIITHFLISCKKEESISEDNYFLHCIMTEGQVPQIKLNKMLNVYPEYAFDIIHYEQLNDKFEMNLNNNNVKYSEFNIVRLKKHQRVDMRYIKHQHDTSDELLYYTNYNIIPKEGESYEIKIDIYDDNKLVKTLSANTTIPSKIPFDMELLNNPSEEVSSDEANFTFQISIDDPIKCNNYYYILPYFINTEEQIDIDTVNIDAYWINMIDYYGIESASIRDYEIPDDVDLSFTIQPISQFYGFEIIGLGNSQQEQKKYIGSLFDDSGFNGNQKQIYNSFTINKSDNITDATNKKYKKYFCVELFHITQEYYDYYNTIFKQINTQLDVYSEPVQAYTNINNGFGLFGGASISRQYVEITDKYPWFKE